MRFQEANGILKRIKLRSITDPDLPLSMGRILTSLHWITGKEEYAQLAPPMKRPRTSEGRPEPDVNGNGIGEDEDVPLAVWQQQRRR